MPQDTIQAESKIRDLEKVKLKGLKEASHHPLHCSRCGAPLLDVMVVKPEFNVTLEYRADCPHCGNHSYPVEVTGGIAIGLLADEPEAYTICVGMEPIDGTVHLRTKKGKKAYVPKKK
jgi:hypothetical protein